MTALTAIVPSRGRPQAAHDVVTAFRHTCEAATRLVFAVDADDPTLPDYQAIVENESEAHVFVGPRESSMVRTLNAAAVHYAEHGNTFAIGFLGDDHRPRTDGWDRAYFNALHTMGTGIVYGNDLLQGENLPTQAAMTTNIISAIGHMAPPDLTHLFVDNYWKALGQGAECLAYLPEVIVEHVHPYAGKAEMDEGYYRVNAPTMYQRDSLEYSGYAARQLPSDIAKVKKIKALRS